MEAGLESDLGQIIIELQQINTATQEIIKQQAEMIAILSKK